MSTTAPTPFRWVVVNRTAAALLGGYAFCWGLVACGIALLFAAGMSFHDAEHLSSMVSLLAYLVVFLWAFAARSVKRVWLVLVGSGLLMTGAASLLQSYLIP